MDTKILQDLLNKRVSRREFLAYVGSAIIAMTGIHAFLKTLSLHGKQKNSIGYGSGPYGGKKKLG
jgi:hypothetical protein